MCGIAGIINRNNIPLEPENKAVLKAMGNQIAYRGPDDEQILTDGVLGVIFRRLAIIDIDGGRQPLSNENGSIVVAVNGEIYNHAELKNNLRHTHIFKSRSDSEIILHLYEEEGISFLEKLNGMFALMLWDRNKRRLILARDRLGIKPLFYSIDNDRILFGSEIKALLAHPDCPCEYDWAQALGYREFCTSPDEPICSFFKDIEHLPGGSCLIYDCNTNKAFKHSYWRIEYPSDEQFNEDTRTSGEIIQGYGALLEDSVRLRLMSDVETGIFLSGGIDSAIIASLASVYEKPHTFSLLNMSTLKNGDAEGAHIAAKQFGLPNHQVISSALQNQRFTPDDWKRLLWQTETHLCFAEQLFKYQLHQYAKMTRPDLKVILLGQGSDEFNGGYSLEYIKDAQLNPAADEWKFLLYALQRFENITLGMRGNPRVAVYGELIDRNYMASFTNQQIYRHAWRYYIDIHRQSLQHYNLWHEDRTAAGNSIENRVPFLDHRLVEYCISIPPSKYAQLFWKKRILYEAFKDVMPEYTLTRPKQPFFYGEHQAFVYRMMYNILIADGRALIDEAFGNSHPVINRRMIDFSLNQIGQQQVYDDRILNIYRLVNMGLLDKMSRDIPAPLNHNAVISGVEAIEIDRWDDEEVIRKIGGDI